MVDYLAIVNPECIRLHSGMIIPDQYFWKEGEKDFHIRISVLDTLLGSCYHTTG
jgi:hypothetical protein